LEPNKPHERKTDVLQGTLALMVLKTLDVLGPLHGYWNRAPHRADKRRPAYAESGHSLSTAIEAGAGRLDRLRVGASENNRKARFYR